MTTSARLDRAEPRITRWLVSLSIVTIVTGMAYSLWWPAVVRHTPKYWTVPGDIWTTVRAARWVDQGLLSYMYSNIFHPVTLPGIELLLAPVVAIGSLFHLSASVPHYPLARPSEWLLVGPVALAFSAVALFGFDSLARALGVPAARRRVLAVAEAAALWPTIALWGHPEDVVALGLCAFALSRVLQGRYVSAAWVLGGALAMQLYVLGAVPVFVGLLGLRRSLPFVLRASVLPLVLFVAMVIPDPHATLHILLDQPNFPTVDHPTPWVLLAPSLGQGVVAAGPGRVVGLALCCALGGVAWFWRHEPERAVWLLGAALGLRCLFESVLDPYYVGPAIGFFLLALAGRIWLRGVLGAAAAAGLTDLVYFRPGMWWYWSEMTAVMVVLAALAWPARVPPPPSSPVEAVSELRDLPADIDPAGPRVPVIVSADS